MHLAVFPDELSKIQDVAQRYKVSRNHLVKVVHRLSLLGYVDSVQGRSGGIRLALKPEDIVVGQVVRNMESTLEVVDCSKSNCPLLPGCLLKGALLEATNAFLEALDQYTVADLVKNRSHIVSLVGGD